MGDILTVLSNSVSRCPCINPAEMKSGLLLRDEVVMRIEVDEQAGFRILRRAAHAHIWRPATTWS